MCSSDVSTSIAYIISAIFICIEYLRIGIFYRRQHRILLISFFIKLSFIIIEIGLAIAFGVLDESASTRKQANAAAILEWGMFELTPFKLNPGTNLIVLQSSLWYSPSTSSPSSLTYYHPYALASTSLKAKKRYTCAKASAPAPFNREMLYTKNHSPQTLWAIEATLTAARSSMGIMRMARIRPRISERLIRLHNRMIPIYLI